MFMTNNSSRSVSDYVKKFRMLGIETTEDDFITSSQATAYYLQLNYPGKKLYVCGTNSLKEELRNNGIQITESLDAVEGIVVGYDTELTYQKLANVCKLLFEKPDIMYIATHPDIVCPTEFGNIPDCGSICDMIFKATGKKPMVIGKPEPLMIQLAMRKYDYKKEETLVIGDRIYTDIKSGLNAGVTSVLGLSGETTPEILQESKEKPHMVLENAGELFSMI